MIYKIVFIEMHIIINKYSLFGVIIFLLLVFYVEVLKNFLFVDFNYLVAFISS